VSALLITKAEARKLAEAHRVLAEIETRARNSHDDAREGAIVETLAEVAGGAIFDFLNGSCWSGHQPAARLGLDLSRELRERGRAS
jgi:hypothetical protein